MLGCKVEFDDQERMLLEKYQCWHESIDCGIAKTDLRIEGPSSIRISDLAYDHQIWATEGKLPAIFVEIPSRLGVNITDLLERLVARNNWGQGGTAKEVMELDIPQLHELT